MALEEETCLLEEELLMLCWLLWEDTELGRPCLGGGETDREFTARDDNAVTAADRS